MQLAYIGSELVRFLLWVAWLFLVSCTLREYPPAGITAFNVGF